MQLTVLEKVQIKNFFLATSKNIFRILKPKRINYGLKTKQNKIVCYNFQKQQI